MGPWKYYAPLWVGTLLSAIVLAYRWGDVAPGLGWLAIVGCPLVGLIGQMLMFGYQGAFAAVLPVPWGRSIRGPGAVLTGALIVVATTAWVVAFMLHGSEMKPYAIAAYLFSTASTLVAAVAYAWNVPSAQRDFGPEGEVLR